MTVTVMADGKPYLKRANWLNFLSEGQVHSWVDCQRCASNWHRYRPCASSDPMSVCDPHHDKIDELVKQMWTIPAHTQEGRRAKVNVPIACIMGRGWDENDKDADYDIRMARSLLIEFVAGEPAQQLQKQFVA